MSQSLDDILKEHSEAAGVCQSCGIIWPCGAWVNAREAADAEAEEESPATSRSPA